ncbi:MAG: 50S ribosomal protein L13 [Candidatus Saccharimonadales bacterium]
MKAIKTYSQKPTEVDRQWYIVDAKDVVLGRLSTVVANYLIGKHKPTYTPHTDGGDHVIVINASKIHTTGNKLAAKSYYRHTGYPGGIKSRTLAEQMAKDPREVIISSIRGMLPDNKLRNGRLARLKVFSGEEHTHEAQQPRSLEVNGEIEEKARS